jgi:hypothetical protein
MEDRFHMNILTDMHVFTKLEIENDDAEMHLEEFVVTVAIVAAST